MLCLMLDSGCAASNPTCVGLNLKRRDFCKLLGLTAVALPVRANSPKAQPAPALSTIASGGDDTAAIRAAFATPGAAYVQAQPGTYVCSDEIIIPPGVTFDCHYATFQFTNVLKNGFVLSADSKLRHARIQSMSAAANDDDKRVFETCNGVCMVDADRSEVRGCTIWGWQHNGIFERDCHDFVIADNTLHSNRFVSGTSADITAWSRSAHYGGRITGNSCFSNNSQGIYVVAGTDEEIIIDLNRCISLDGLNWAEPSKLRRRHGIMVGYDGARRRALVSRNTIRRTTQTGICCQAHQAVTGSIHIVNNIIGDTGKLVGPTNGVISAIAMLVQGEGDLVSGNQIENHVYADGGAAGISVQPGAAAGSEHASTLITGNTVTRAETGIVAIAAAQNVTIANNQISPGTGHGIVLRPDFARGYADTLTATGNRVTMPVGSTQPAIMVSLPAQSSLTRLIVDGNVLKGRNKAAYETTNAGVHVKGQANIDQTDGALVTIANNTIEGFSLGVSTNFYMSAAPIHFRIDNNRVTDCTIGLAIPGVAGSGARLIATGNRYKGCTYALRPGPLSGQLAVWEGALNYGSATVFADAAPTTGGWSAGDQIVRRPAVAGQPRGWRCTVGGVPGTWVSDGNL
jgi:hypothetical protein